MPMSSATMNQLKNNGGKIRQIRVNKGYEAYRDAALYLALYISMDCNGKLIYWLANGSDAPGCLDLLEVLRSRPRCNGLRAINAQEDCSARIIRLIM